MDSPLAHLAARAVHFYVFMLVCMHVHIFKGMYRYVYVFSIHT